MVLQHERDGGMISQGIGRGVSQTPDPIRWDQMLIGEPINLLEFEFHLDLQENSSNNVCSKWRMKKQIEQNKPHRKQTSIAQEFTISFTIIISAVKIVYIGRIWVH